MEKQQFSLCLITGASSGVGEALARLAADKGINLILCARNEERLKALSGELSAKVKVNLVIADLAASEGRSKLIEAIHREAPDLVINNAGRGVYGDALTAETREAMQMMELNGMAILELTLEAARTLVSFNKRGVILNVSSVAAFLVFPKFAIYAASKAFVNHLSESLDAEMRPYGVRILAACPGMVATNFRKNAGQTQPFGKGRLQSMSSEFAAEQIWWQIEKQKPVYAFNWPYRLIAFLAKYILPKKLLERFLSKSIEERIAKKEIIKINHA